MLRSILVAAVAAAGVLMPGGARAEGTYWPWCIDYRDSSYNCGFATFEQCLATAIRLRGLCRENPLGPPRPAQSSRRPAR
jgi:hypothetical protein